MKKTGLLLSGLLSIFMALGVACDKKEEAAQAPPSSNPAPAAPNTPGVDAERHMVRIGTLNDESGPGAAIGKPFAVGKRVLYERVNAGGSGLLPDGWKVTLIEKDHGYNPQKSVQSYKEIKDDVLFLATSFSTPSTLPLKPLLKADGMVAFPASLSSEMAGFAYTPPIGASYKNEAKRAMDWAVSKSGPGKVKAAIIYQQDDYGADGLAGWKEAAALHGVTIVSEQTITPGQTDFAAVVTALKNEGANYVLMTTLPSATGPILGTAAQLGFKPTWIGNTPSWIDAFFNPQVIPAGVFANYHLMSGLPFWGEDVPGMKDFLDAYQSYGKDMHQPDSYILLSYIQGLAQVEALNLMIKSKDLTRKGYLSSLQTLNQFNANGMIQDLDLSSVPYKVGNKTRVLTPVMDQHTWNVSADYSPPQTTPGKAAVSGEKKKSNFKRPEARSNRGSRSGGRKSGGYGTKGDPQSGTKKGSK